VSSKRGLAGQKRRGNKRFYLVGGYFMGLRLVF
jgi:hypothetical protein